jgi:hypothetical protein
MNYINILVFFCSILFPVMSLKTAPKPKICINCKHFIPNTEDSEFGKCSAFPKKEGQISYLVNGVNTNKYFYCSVARESPNMCGEEGKHYKQKPVVNTPNKPGLE